MIYFDGSGNPNCRNAAFSNPALPFTLACWFQTSGDSTTTQSMVSFVNAFNYFFRLGLYTGKVIAQHASNSGAIGYSSTTYSLNTPQHAAAVFASTTSRTAYLNGGNSGSNTTSKTTLTGSIAVGLILSGSPTNDWDRNLMLGYLWEVGIWSVALTADEVAALAKGYTPLDIRPASLLAYYPFGGRFGNNAAERWKNRYDLTEYNSPSYAAHGRVIYPTRMAA